MHRDPNPNRSPFPRNTFLEAMGAPGTHPLHPLQRDKMQRPIARLDPDNWRHSLGALDVLMDNAGLLVQEQFPRKKLPAGLESDLKSGLVGYLETASLVLPSRPWTGDYLLSSARSSNSGEPRPVIRLLLDHNGRGLESTYVARCLMQNNYRVEDLPWNDLFSDDWAEGPERLVPARDRQTGLLVPIDAELVTPPVRLLPPDQCTPDLPLRVGLEEEDRALYAALVSDQGEYPTCVAHAISVGLDVAARRVERGQGGPTRFSPAWIHRVSGVVKSDPEISLGWNFGRRLEDGVEAITKTLPCAESAFPYSEGPTSGPNWRRADRVASAQELTKRFGPPLVRRVNTSNIAELKTLLAAGWVIVVGAHFPMSWQRGACTELGLPCIPEEGESRSACGHAWLLVGYDHVDGNQQWKYQGRFWALTSWGSSWPLRGFWGAGMCSIPFAFFLTEGISAYALRFQER